MKYLSLFILLMVWVFVGCESTIVNGSEEGNFIDNSESVMSSLKTIKMVPFKGSYSGTIGLDFSRTDCPFGSLPVSGNGSGMATHLGKIDVFYSLCSYNLVNPNNPEYVDGYLTIIAANGDEITGDFYGSATGQDSFIDHVTITSGTGRFEYTSGSFTEYGTPIITDQGPALEIKFEGMISSVGLSK